MKDIMKSFLARGLAALLLLGITLCTSDSGGYYLAQAQDDPRVTLSVRAGFDGYYKEGMWVPVQVQVANDGPAFTGAFSVVTDRYDGTQTTYLRTIELPTQSRKGFFIYVAPEAFLRQVEVTLRDGRQEIARASSRLSQAAATDLIFAIMAGSPSAFNVLADVDPVGGSALVAQMEIGQLPDQARTLDALDVILVSDIDTGVLSAPQREALAGWVSGGGTLLVAGGPSWQRTAAGLQALLPLEPGGTRTLGSLPALEVFAPGTETLSGPAVTVVGELAEGAVPLASQDGLTLIASQTRGAGQVVYIAADPALAPLRGWEGAEALYRSVLAGSPVQPLWTHGLDNGYYALQAAFAVPGLDLPSGYQLCGFLAIYIVAVGPVNYLILKRLKRRELAWLTIPVVVGTFSGLAYMVGSQVRGRNPILERLSVLQVWPDAETSQVDAIVGVFSPSRTSYELEVDGNFLVRPLPDSSGGLGGSNSSELLEQNGGTVIHDLRVEIGAVKVFLAEGSVEAPRFESDLMYELGGSSASLSGRVTNHSQYTLQDAVLLALGGVQRLGILEPGQSSPIQINLSAQRAIPGLLAGRLGIVQQPRAGGAARPPPGPGSYFGGYDQTINDILGTGDYYQDRELYRRYSMLYAMLDPNSGGAGLASGVYLLGWAGESPLPARLNNARTVAADTTLLIVNLNPRLNVTRGRLVLPPALFTWTGDLDEQTQGVDRTPYDMYIDVGRYSLSFRPTWPIQYNSVESLTLHLRSYGSSGPAGLIISLWDFRRGDWDALGEQSWGDIPVPEPARFVGPSGEIRLLIAQAGGPPVNIERSDFTLIVDQ